MEIDSRVYDFARRNGLWYDVSTNSSLSKEEGRKLIAERKRVGNHTTGLIGTHTRQLRSFEMNSARLMPVKADVIDRWTKDSMVVVPSTENCRSLLLSTLEQARVPFYNWEEFGGLAIVLSRNHRQEVLQALNSEGVKISYQSREVMEQKWRNSQIQTFEYQVSRKGQDRFFQLAEDGVIISLLFDGHGSDTVIDYISAHRTDFVELGLEPFPETNAEVFERVSRVFIEFEDVMRKKIKDMYSGSTLVLAVHKLATKKVFFAHIGDSRAIWSLGGKVFGSKDHKPSDPEEKARIVSLGGRVTQARRDVPRVNENLATSRSFGDETLKTTDRQKDLVSVIPSVYGPYTFPSGSFYGLGSDGVFDVMSNEETIKILSTGQKSGTNVAQKVVEESVQKGSLDDITFGCLYVL